MGNRDSLDDNILNAQDFAGDVQDQVTGSCFSVPAAAFAVLFLIFTVIFTFS